MSVARFGRQKKENELPEIRAYAPGIYARSEELVQATRDLDRGRTSEEAVEEQRLADLRAFIEAQREAGLDYFSDGLLNWQDVFRPFDESAEGLRPGPLTRFLNTNTFYRAPVVEAETPKLIQPLSEPFFRIEELPRGRWVATLPSPYSLAEQAAGEIEPRTVAETMLGPQIRWLADNGCAYLVLQETALFSKASGASDSYRLSEALDALARPLPIALQLPFGDAGNILGELMELDVDAIGVDFYATDASSLPRPFPKTLLAGVIDARNSLLEEAEAVADFARSLLEDMGEGTQLHLVPNGDLQFVPEKIARDKVIRLGAAARILKDAATEEGALT
jgi:5-methyltetrahydropteroyltriglutamate--homocysteine methyltransferase